MIAFFKDRLNMRIRTTNQLDQLARDEFIRWRSTVHTEIALLLAKCFTAQELSCVVDNRYEMKIIRAGYHLNELKALEESVGKSVQHDVFYFMAESIRNTFTPIELGYMDGWYNNIFEDARLYCGSFPKEGDEFHSHI